MANHNVPMRKFPRILLWSYKFWTKTYLFTVLCLWFLKSSFFFVFVFFHTFYYARAFDRPIIPAFEEAVFFFFFFLFCFCTYSYSVVAERINAVLRWFGTSTTFGITVSKRKQCSWLIKKALPLLIYCMYWKKADFKLKLKKKIIMLFQLFIFIFSPARRFWFFYCYFHSPCTPDNNFLKTFP